MVTPRSTAARKKQGAKRPAAKESARVSSTSKKAAVKKPAPPKKAPPSKKAAIPKRAATPKKVVVPKKAVTPKKRAKATPERERERRPAKTLAFINPQQQLAKALAEPSAPSPARAMSRGVAGPTMPEGFFSAYTGAGLTEQDYADAAKTLECEVASVKAVAEVETAGASFDANKRPTILYERHVFSRCTVPPGKFNNTYPDLSADNGYPRGGYGTKDQQFDKLARAFQLDQIAALKAPSWGKFQILGENHKACGFATVADYVKAMTISESEHLKAFVGFLLSSPKRLEAIRKKDWPALALYYNGKDYAKFQYDTKLAAAYVKHAGAS